MGEGVDSLRPIGVRDGEIEVIVWALFLGAAGDGFLVERVTEESRESASHAIIILKMDVVGE